MFATRWSLCFLLGILTVGCSAPVISEQRALPSLSTSPTYTSAEADQGQDAAWGDMDGDGDLDLAVANIDDPNRVYRNDDGVFVLAWTSAVQSQESRSVAWGDMDGDGAPDLAFTNTQSADTVHRNRWATNPTVPFAQTPAWESDASDASDGGAWADVDGDGDLDFAVAFDNTDVDGGAAVYLNTGALLETTASWRVQTGDPSTGTCWGDWDGDGAPELAVVSNVGSGNDGLERVFANTGAALGTTPAWTSTSTLRRDLRDCAWADWDGDGDADLVVGASDSLGTSPNGVYSNLGGTLGADFAWSTAESDETQRIAVGDWDGDGDADLVAFNESGPPRVHVNDGTGAMTVGWSGPIGVKHAGDLGDMDGDGDLDLAILNWQAPLTIFTNRSSPVAPGWTGPAAGVRAAFADVDGDGDLDLATAGPTGVQVWVNDGSGDLGAAPGWTPAETGPHTAVAWGDLDGDGLPELAATTPAGSPLRVWTNAITGLGATATPSVELDDSSSLAFGDVDGDGDLDLAVGNDGANRLYLNTAGVLALGTTLPESEPTSDLAWGDQDGDGLPELAVANGAGAPVRVHANAAGVLVSTWSSASTAADTSIAWGDADGSGSLDLAVGSEGADRVYENPGAGLVLTAPAWSTPANRVSPTTAIAFTDHDGDGALDLITTGPSTRAWAPTSALGFTLSWTLPGPTEGVAAADLDGRGGLGLLLLEGDGARAVESPGGFALTVYPPPGGTPWVGEVALGDLDGDGDQDAVVNTSSLGSRSYLHAPGGFVVDWLDPIHLNHQDFAWADVDGDGDLDFSAATATSPGVVDNLDRVYLNDGNRGFAPQGAAPLNVAVDHHDHEWFDVDGDADLDLVVTGQGQSPVVLYTNDGGTLTQAWDSGGGLPSRAVRAMDWDADGDDDLLVAHYTSGTIFQYQNVGGTLGSSTALTLAGITRINALDVGDWDGDGDLDLVLGTPSGVSIQLKQSGGLIPGPERLGDEINQVGFVDWDGDGDLEVISRAYLDHLRIFENVGGGLVQVWRSPEPLIYRAFDAADVDGDGDLDLIAGVEGQGAGLYVFLNGRQAELGLPSTPTTAALLNPGAAPLAGLTQRPTGTPLTGLVQIDFVLTDAESDPVPSVRLEYSVTSGSLWQTASVSGGTTDLATSPAGTAHSVDWDVVTDGIAADRVELRLVVEGQRSGTITSPTLRGSTATRLPFLRAHPCYPEDADGDGVGCLLDCDDLDALVFPSAAETCDAIDSDCDGSLVDGDPDADGDGLPDCIDDDDDGDGVTDATDCDDANSAIYPGAPEVSANGIDEDCNGIDAIDCFADGDGDGYGGTTPSQELDDGDCSDDAGQSAVSSDCDDAAISVNPGAVEVCNGMDDDCDGLPSDEADGDGDGALPCGGDCDDADPARFPGNAEICDQQDNDCDAATDEGVDNDADGASECDGDCDDAEPAAFPGNVEVCDAVDNDCDATTDEFADIDGDGRSACVGDCDESDPDVYAGAVELCDGKDGDCDGVVPADELTDVDGDGSPVCADCADDDAAVFPEAEETCNGVDDDCDDATDEDVDGDGDGVTVCAGDCDDADPDTSPEATEASVAACIDGVDNDCDGLSDGDAPSCADALDPDLSPGCAVACSAGPDAPAPWGLALLPLLLLWRRRRARRIAPLLLAALLLPAAASAGDVLILAEDARDARAQAARRLPPGTSFLAITPTTGQLREGIWILGGALGPLCPTSSLTPEDVAATLSAAEARIDALDVEGGADDLIELRQRLGCLTAPVDAEALWRLHFYEAVIGWYSGGPDQARRALAGALAVRPGAAFDDAYPPAMRDVFQEAQRLVQEAPRGKLADGAGVLCDGAGVPPEGLVLLTGEHLIQLESGQGLRGGLLAAGPGAAVVVARAETLLATVGTLDRAEQQALAVSLRATAELEGDGPVWLVVGEDVVALGDEAPQPIQQERRRALLRPGPVLQIGVGIAHEQVGTWPYLAVPVDLDVRIAGPVRAAVFGRVAVGARKTGVADPDQRLLPLLLPFGGGLLVRLDGVVSPVFGVLAHFAVDENQDARRLLAGPTGWLAADIALGRSPLAVRPHLGVGSLGRWFHLRAGLQIVLGVGR